MSFSQRLDESIEAIYEMDLPLDDIQSVEDYDIPKSIEDIPKCEVCGGKCSEEVTDDGVIDHICMNPSCPMYGGDRPKIKEQITMEDKMGKGFKIISESAHGKISRRMHRLLETASVGKPALTEEEWTKSIGKDNFDYAVKLGLLSEQDFEPDFLDDEEEITPDDIPDLMGDEEDFEAEEEVGEEVGEEELEDEMEAEADIDAEADIEADIEVGVEEPVDETLNIDDVTKVLEALRGVADEAGAAMIDTVLGASEGPVGEPEGLPEGPGEEEPGLEEPEIEVDAEAEIEEPGLEEPEIEVDAEAEIEPEEPEDLSPMESFDRKVNEAIDDLDNRITIKDGTIYVKNEDQVVDEGYVVLEAKKNGWPKDLEEGRFTEYCKKQGFDGPCISCAKKAMESDDSSVRGMAAYYMNTVKPEGKDLGDITDKED